MSINSSFGQHLTEERKKRSLTAEKFAKMCGTSRSYITLIENNRRLPGTKILPKIAAALQIKTVVVLNWYLEDISKKIHKDIGLPLS